MPEKNIDSELILPQNCNDCPRRCGVNRLAGKHGYCNSDSGYNISSIVIHKGEEPAISGKNGICNVFFSHCNLSCLYCQNYQISQKNICAGISEWQLDEVIKKICSILDTGIENLGFVSPSHMIPQVKSIAHTLKLQGYTPVIVYNTNAYDNIDTLRKLVDIVDVYLPDFKYADAELAKKLSDAEDYPQTALKALKEMYRQTGIGVKYNNGKAVRGTIVRHLVLPGHVNNSIEAMNILAREISNEIHISVMSQYHPVPCVSEMTPLNRSLTEAEYSAVTDEIERLGFINGWVQEHESSNYYIPDFRKKEPFNEMSE